MSGPWPGKYLRSLSLPREARRSPRRGGDGDRRLETDRGMRAVDRPRPRSGSFITEERLSTSEEVARRTVVARAWAV